MELDQILSVLESIGALLFVFFFIGFCIFFHELGHFLVAKWRGLHVDAFSIGFKKIWGKKINGVEYRIGCIPLGGYVELPQVDSSELQPKAADGTLLERAKPIDRILTAASGPLFNVLFGLLLGCAVWIFGMPAASPVCSQWEVATVEAESPEYRAGLRPGDMIVRLNGDKVRGTQTDFISKLLFAIGEVKLDVVRDGKPIQIAYTPIENPNAPGRLKYEKIGYPFFTVKIPIELQPMKNSPAARAGILTGDKLLTVDGKPVSDLLVLQLMLNAADGKGLTFEIDRHGKTLKIPVVPELVPNLPPEFSGYKIGVAFLNGNLSADEVAPLSPAEAAGVRNGDKFTAINGKPLKTPQEMIQLVNATAGKPFTLTIDRDGKTIDLQVSARKSAPRTIGVELLLRSYPTPWEQLENTCIASYKSLRGMLVSAAHFLKLTDQTSTLKARHMSGPLGMGDTLYSMVKSVSLMTGIHFVVMISFALAIFNLLPLPVLDGGHIAFALVELIIRRPIPTWVVRHLSTMFITLLIALMIYITYFDVMRTYRRIAGEPQPQPPAAEQGAKNAK